jgi:glycosyltransferase involved in cell wall biosynthesis
MAKSIVYFQQSFPKLTETFILAELNELRRRNYDVWVIGFDIDHQLLTNSPIADRVVTVPRDSTVEGTYRNLIQAIHSKSPSYLHAHWVTEAGRILRPIAEQLNIPFGFTAHAADLWLRGNRLEPEELNALGHNRLCVTAAVEGTRHRDYLQQCGFPVEKIVITPNAVDASLLPTLLESRARKIKNVLAVGRPVAKKGFFVAVDAIRLARLQGVDLSLRIIGGGDTSSELGRSLTNYVSSFPDVEVEAMMSHSDVLMRMSQADLLLMPSMIAENGDSDGLPTVLTEAMLMGLPVVTTDVASISDLVRDGETGFISRAGDPASLAKGIIRAINVMSDEVKAVSLLDSAKLAARRHEIHSSVSALVRHLESCLGNLTA